MANELEVQNDVALWNYKKNCLVFKDAVKKGSLIRVLDLRSTRI